VSQGPDFSIGEAAAMIGVSAHAIRAWERRHDLPRPRRSASNQRRYSADDVEMLRGLREASAARGLSLRLAALEARGEATVAAPGEPSRPAAASEAGEPWRAVADLLADVVVLLNPDGRVIDANVPFARLTGKLRYQLPGMPFADLVQPYDRAKAVRAYQRPLRRRRRWELNLAGHASIYSFDCSPLLVGAEEMLVMVGRELRTAGEEWWPGELP
jgi:PAS domain-containing protein